MYTRLALGILLAISSLAGFAQQGGEGPVIAERFRALSRSSTWEKVSETPMAFRTYHPQGMEIVRGRLYLTSVEVVDRVAGKGVAHLFEADLNGRLLREARLNTGDLYHPSGIAFDGRDLWLAVSEYRPESRSLILRVSPVTLNVEALFGYDEHFAAVLADRSTQIMVAVNWGSRRYYRWSASIRNGVLTPESSRAPTVVINGSHYIDYKDCQVLLDTGFALFSGVSTISGDRDSTTETLGGIELVSLKQLIAHHQVPIPLRTAKGLPMTQSAFHVGLAGEGLRFYFLPEDDESKLYVYDVTP